MAIKVSPGIPDPTHHIQLTDRRSKSLGLILCDKDGNPIDPKDGLQKVPIERTALKTSSGNSSYSDFEWPYSPIVQDDFSGGRANLDFERDSTRYYDSFRMRTGRANKAFLGPQEQFTKGYRDQDYSAPGSVKFLQLIGANRFIAKRFQASSSYTAALAWLMMARTGKPGDATIAIYSDSAGQINASLSSIAVPYTRLPDILSEWLNETMSQALVSGTYYWMVVDGGAGATTDKHWKIAVKAASGSYTSTAGGAWANWTAADVDLYFRTTNADQGYTCIFKEYKEQLYAFVSGATGAPKIYMNGDRGAADSNVGQLTKLIDATKNWVVNEHVGSVVMITDGPGKTEAVNYRVVLSNTATELVVDTYTITHTTATEYVILGSPKWREITGHGLTDPVTDVLVSTQGVVYVCMGDSITVRRLRAFNDAGTWRDFDDAANCQADETASTKAVFMIYKPQSQVIYMASNSDASGNVSVAKMSNASVPAWGSALTWNTAVPIGSKYRRIRGLIIYPDDDGVEALWVGKTDRPWIVPNSGNPYPFALAEMENVRSDKNFATSLTHNVYLWFSMLNGLERWYAGQLDDAGPNLGEGLPAGRQGPVSAMIGYPGKFFVSVDAGATGYSSVLDRESGFHERYRAPKGRRITAMAFQVVPGTKPDRLWIYQGNDLIWLPMPSDTTNELEDSEYLYAAEGAIVQSRMHAGMMDVQKILKVLKLWTDSLEKDVCWIEMDYRLNDAEDWTTLKHIFSSSPQSEADLSATFGIAAKRIQFRLRFYTTNASLTPVLLVTIYDAVMRADVKYMYPLTFRLMDEETTLAGEPDDVKDGLVKLKMLEDWADASSDGLLDMKSVSRLLDGKKIFLNPPLTRPALERRDDDTPARNIYICQTSVQEA